MSCLYYNATCQVERGITAYSVQELFIDVQVVALYPTE